MRRYRVDFYIGDRVAYSVYTTEYYRRGAYFNVMNSPEMFQVALQASAEDKQWTWDATDVGPADS